MVCYEGLTILILSFLVGLLSQKLAFTISYMYQQKSNFMNVTMTFDEVVRILGYVPVVFISAKVNHLSYTKKNISTILSNER